MMYALVIGGTKGIGKAIVGALVSRGYHVLVTYSSDQAAAQVVQEEFGTQVSVYQVDQKNRQEVRAFAKALFNRLPQINCIVCNAGMTLRKNYQQITDQEWDEVMHVSVGSHLAIIQELHDKIAQDGRIIFIGSMMGIVPHASSLAYGVAKASMHALAMNLVKEFWDTAITVNVIAPGFIETEWQQEKPVEIRDRICKKTAAGRFGYVDEVSQACMYCIDNAFVNGSVLEVSGGYSLR